MNKIKTIQNEQDFYNVYTRSLLKCTTDLAFQMFQSNQIINSRESSIYKDSSISSNFKT